jgi:MFS family permease
VTNLPDFLRLNARWLGAGFLLTLGSSFGQTFFISVFAGEIRAEFALTHGAWGALYSAATMASAAVMLFAGGLTDRFRVRHIGPATACALALACLAMAVAGGVWALALALFLLRLMGQGMMGHAAATAMARWFAASRGRALSVAGLGVAAGEALLPLGFAALLGVAGWRALWVVAAVALVLLAPVLRGLLREERLPQSFAASAGGAGMDGRQWRRSEVLRHPLFWLMLPALLGPPAWNTAFFFHQVHIAEAKGWSHLAIVALFPLFTVASIVSMIAAGWVVDRFGSARLAAVFLLPSAAGFAALALAGTPQAAAVAVLLLGATAGMNVTLAGAFWAEHFGTAHLGRIRAMVAAVMVIGSALGPGVTGVLIDAGLPFHVQGWTIAALALIGATLAGTGAGRARSRLAAIEATHEPEDSAMPGGMRR